MKKSHITYLRRAIGIASGNGKKTELPEQIESIKGAQTPVYQMIRDIVCDARFYAILEDKGFWKDYSVASISAFIDSLTDDDWTDEEQRTGKKEDFLNSWLSEHMLPFTETEQEDIVRRLKTMPTGGSLMFENETTGSSTHTTAEFSYGFGIKDKTDADDPPEPDLPSDIREVLGGGADSMSGLQSEWERRETEYINRVDPSLVELARKIGRCGEDAKMIKGRFQHASKSDITGVMVGNDLNRLLPNEVAMLASAETESIFFRRYVTKQLQLFSSASSSTKREVKNNGPIYMCVDTSGSMAGEPEIAAKRLALCIAIIAGREKRPVFVVNYSHTLSFFMLTDLRMQRKKFLSFLSRSYAGGNDERKLFHFLFHTLPMSPSYRHYVKMLEGADLLVMSDFQWNKLGKETKRLINHAKAGGMRFHALGVYMGTEALARSECSREGERGWDNEEMKEEYKSGFDFFSDCEGRYVFNGGRV
ncbi:MAG: hypothetical protein K2L34_10380 [Muribaculaceae bacterium]|nr:hypothetical protein [Muribaculaceae bacterium]